MFINAVSVMRQAMQYLPPETRYHTTPHKHSTSCACVCECVCIPALKTHKHIMYVSQHKNDEEISALQMCTIVCAEAIYTHE